MVLEFTARDLADVANVQAYVGGELAARAAENISAEQLSELTAIQDRLERAYADTDPDRTVRLNHEFHRLINVAAASRISRGFAGHDHTGVFALAESDDDPLPHFVTLPAILTSPPGTTAGALAHIYDDRIELVGFGNCPSARLPFRKR